MVKDEYNLVFLGAQTRDARDLDWEAVLVRSLEIRLKISKHAARRLIQSAPVMFCKGIKLHEAQQMKKLMEKIGASVRIDAVQSHERTRPATTARQAARGEMSRAMPEEGYPQSIPVIRSQGPTKVEHGRHVDLDDDRMRRD